MDVAGVWQPSDKATEHDSRTFRIQKAEPNMIFTAFSPRWGLPLPGRPGNSRSLRQVGINVEAKKTGFWEATKVWEITS